MNTTIDLMLLASIAGAGIFIGLVTLMVILLILKLGEFQRRGSQTADAETAPETPPKLDPRRWRGAFAVLITGVLLISLGLPAALLALSTDDAPAADKVSPSPLASTAPASNATPAPAPETPPTTPPVTVPESEVKPETLPEQAAPDNFVVSKLLLTPDPESGHNWYRASVNIANTGSAAGTMLLTAKVGDRSVTPQVITLGGGDNLTLELKSIAHEIGFLASMYESGVSTQRRHEVVVQNLRETLFFEHTLRMESTTSGKIIQPDWEILSRNISDAETLLDAGVFYTFRRNWQITLRSNTEPDRVFTITVTFRDANGDIVRSESFENNELPRWSTWTFRNFVDLTPEEKERVTGYQISVLCTSGCGGLVD